MYARLYRRLARRMTGQVKDTAQIATRVAAEDYAALQALADADHRSVAAYVRLVLKNHLRETGAESAA